MNNKIIALASGLKAKSSQLKSWASLLAVPAIFLAPGAQALQEKNEVPAKNSQCCTKLTPQNSQINPDSAQDGHYAKISHHSFEITIPRFHNESSGPLEIFNNPAEVLNSIDTQSLALEALENSNPGFENSLSNKQDLKSYSFASSYTSTSDAHVSNVSMEALSFAYFVAFFLLAVLLGTYASYLVYTGAAVQLNKHKNLAYQTSQYFFNAAVQRSINYVIYIHNAIAQKLKTLRYHLSLLAQNAMPPVAYTA